MAEEKKEEKKELAPQERGVICQKEVEAILKKHNCGLAAVPLWRRRDDGTFSLIVNIETAPLNTT